MWENVCGCQQYCCGCKVADCPNIVRIIGKFFWPIYLLNTELKEEWIHNTAKCYKNLNLRKVVKQQLRSWAINIPPWINSFWPCLKLGLSVSVTEFLHYFFPCQLVCLCTILQIRLAEVIYYFLLVFSTFLLEFPLLIVKWAPSQFILGRRTWTSNIDQLLHFSSTSGEFRDLLFCFVLVMQPQQEGLQVWTGERIICKAEKVRYLIKANSLFLKLKQQFKLILIMLLLARGPINIVCYSPNLEAMGQDKAILKSV